MLAVHRAIEARKIRRPWEWYVPSFPGHPGPFSNQLGFHQAIQPIRTLFPGNGWGKGLRHGEPVLTPKGWKAIDQVEIGDTLLGRDGKPCRVLGVYPQGRKQCHRIAFSDGTHVDCDGDHLWTVKLRNNRFKRPGFEQEHGNWTTISVDEMLSRFGDRPSVVSRPVVPSCEPVVFGGRHPEIPAYLVGLLIGDGGLTAGSVRFSTRDPELCDALRQRWTLKPCGKDFRVNGAGLDMRRLGLMGKYSYEKRIPTEYLTAPEEDRWEMLAGLMDTDGNCEGNKDAYCTTSLGLAHDFIFLVQSLGGTAIIESARQTSYTYKGETRKGLPSWRVRITTAKNPYRLNRKADLWLPRQVRIERRIVSITPIGEYPTTCIRVDSPDSLFLTRGFIPTHNTTCLGAEANAWGYHSNLWQRTPEWPVLMLWFAKLKDQFAMICEQLRTQIFGTEVAWKASDAEFRWPDGSKLVVGLADDASTWKKWQGIPVDLVIFDEEPPKQLYREMMMRRRGQRKTRFCVGATATTGDSWMAKEIYQPWEEHHKALGLDATRALWEQSHPDIWLWWRGGVGDNPGADAGDVAWYEGRTWSSPKEREVRLKGGFQSWTGDPVFDPDAIALLEQMAEAAELERGPGQIGSLICVTTE